MLREHWVAAVVLQLSNTLREFAKQKYSSYQFFFILKKHAFFKKKQKKKKKEKCLLTLQIFTA